MSLEAVAFAEGASPEMRISFLEIAESWLQLAENIEWATRQADSTKHNTFPARPRGDS
jgi:hypothetical protein